MSIPPNTQANRPMEVFTPLGIDEMLLVGFSGREAISQLFDYTLDVVTNSRGKVPFEKLLGQPLTVRLELAGRKQRFFHGICNQVSQGESDHHFTRYQLGMVPAFWLLTKRAQCRIFQQMTVREILEEVLKELDVAFEIGNGFHRRDYCVQYRETDFAFASRLMEEEGIWYYFDNTNERQTLVVANTPRSHPDLPPPTTVIYENVRGGNRKGEERIHAWQKTQALCSA